MDSLHLSRMTVREFLGIEELVVEFDGKSRVTRLLAGNGRGKTSLIEAIKMLGGGNDVKVIRSGADQADLMFEFSNGVKAHKVIRPGSPRLTVKKDGDPTVGPSPQTYLNKFVAAAGLNPLDALAPAGRRDFLLKALDTRITASELESLVGVAPPPVNYDRHALLVMEDVHGWYYAQRMDKRRTMEAKEGAAKEALGALPATPHVAEKDIAGMIQKADQALADARVRVRSEQAKSEEVGRRAKGLLAAEHAVAAAIASVEVAKKTLHDCEIKAAEAGVRLDGLREEGAAAGPDQAVIDSAQAEIENALQERTALEGLRTAWAEHKRYASLKSDADDARSAWEEINQQVQAVGPDAQAAVLAKTGLPEGLEYKSGNFLYSGHPVETLSQAETVRLAVNLVKLTAKDAPLKLMLLDNIECLDRDSLKELSDEQSKDDGWHYVLASVAHDPDGNPLPLTVGSGPAPSAAVATAARAVDTDTDTQGLWPDEDAIPF